MFYWSFGRFVGRIVGRFVGRAFGRVLVIFWSMRIFVFLQRRGDQIITKETALTP